MLSETWKFPSHIPDYWILSVLNSLENLLLFRRDGHFDRGRRDRTQQTDGCGDASLIFTSTNLPEARNQNLPENDRCYTESL